MNEKLVEHYAYLIHNALSVRVSLPVQQPPDSKDKMSAYIVTPLLSEEQSRQLTEIIAQMIYTAITGDFK